MILFTTSSLITHAEQNTNQASKVFKKTSTSIVAVRTTRIDGTPYKQGSGIVVRKNQIATNCHLIFGSTSINIESNGKPTIGTLTHGDALKDLCLISIPSSEFPVAEAREFKTITTGESIFAIGRSGDLEPVILSGLISKISNTKYLAIQTNTQIPQEINGGGIFDAKGMLIGIITIKDNKGEVQAFSISGDTLLELQNTTIEKITNDLRFSYGLKIKQLLEKRQSKEAIIYSEEWIKSDPFFFRPHWLIGVALTQMDQHEAAVTAFQKAIELKPDQQDTWRLKGASLWSLQKYTAAIADYKEALRLDPSDSRAWGLLSSAYMSSNQTDNAIECIRQALHIKETDVDYRWLAFLLQVSENNKSMKDAMKTGHTIYAQNHKHIIEAWRKAFDINPQNPENVIGLLDELDHENLCAEATKLFIYFKLNDKISSTEYINKHKQKNYQNCQIENN